MFGLSSNIDMYVDLHEVLVPVVLPSMGTPPIKSGPQKSNNSQIFTVYMLSNCLITVLRFYRNYPS